MIKKQEKIITFSLQLPEAVKFTHGYNISNSFPVHFHATYTIGIVEKGERIFNYRNESTIVQKNDLFLIQPFEPHSCQSPDKKAHSYKIISFESLSEIINPYFRKLLIKNEELTEKIKMFHTLAEFNNTSSEITSLWDAIKLQLTEIAEPENSTIETKTNKAGIKKAKEFIKINCVEQISLNQAAEVANMSEFHFNRLFHQMIGMSPYAYLLFCRVKKSQELLIQGGSVTGTAYETGFFDQSHFIRLFRKHTGVTPGSFLRDNRNLQQQ